MSPWYVKTPPGVSILQIPLLYHNPDEFSTMPGIVSTDILHDTHQQLMLKNYGETLLPRGTPLAMYIPIRREKFETIIRNETDEDYKTRIKGELVTNTKFSGGYREIVKKKGSCPVSSA